MAVSVTNVSVAVKHEKASFYDCFSYEFEISGSGVARHARLPTQLNENPTILIHR
jgi:hypothetical protein